MNKKWLWTSVVLVLASASFWLTPSTAHAQSWRSWRNAWSGTGSPYYSNYGYYYPGYSYSSGYYYPQYYSGYYYPSYSSYYYPSYSYSVPAYSSYYYSTPTYSYSTPAYSYSTPAYSTQSYYYGPGTTYVTPSTTTSSYQAPMPAPQDGNTAHIAVHVPAENATVWIAGQRMSQAGTDRNFVTPPLTAGRTYSYEIRAQWTTASGQVANQTRTVSFQPGQTVNVDFTSTATSY